ncbi:hypothetical protein COB11_02395 [Candidatus Aerophobetes bacterium]|uniref:FAD-binding domain-containing protein n=1 Tax=Aerophobetes bacterium TaxID=2030807 RepID=A0A2A4YM42_UNCAE|nr:MAG: hypothetical protein COB11_02395 [Candidatus Aerophobetes bacterium]
MSVRSNNIAYKADAVFVGGGPVGLFTAAQIKAINPDAKVTVVERYSEYKRKHVLIIDSASLSGMTDHPELKKFAETIKKSNTIATSKIESDLKNIALELGVKIIHEKVEDPSKLCKKFKNAKVIFGTDGAHSIIRKKIFGGEKSVRETISHIAEVKYLTTGEGHRTKKILKSSIKHYSHRWVTEHVGKKNAKGKTSITIRLALSKREFEILKGSGRATFKDPLNLNSDEDKKLIPKKLLSTINKWHSIKKKLYNETAEDVKITATSLDVYKSKEIVTKKNNITYALVGDSAFGVPFFRSLNNGLLCATKAAKEFAPKLTLKENDLTEASDKYKSYVTSLAKTQIMRAKIKGSVLSIYFSAIRIVSGITHLPLKEKIIDFFVKIIYQINFLVNSITSFYSTRTE